MEKRWKSKTILITVSIILFIVEKIKTIQISSKCANKKYYDTNEYECFSCPYNMVPRADGLGCTCDSLSYFVYNNLTIIQAQAGSSNSNFTQCASCPNGTISSIDRSACLNCVNGIENNECACPTGYAIQERDLLTGILKKTKSCALCPNGTLPGPTGPIYNCLPCPDGKIYDTNRNPWECVCDQSKSVTAGDICIPLQDSIFLTTTYPVNTAKSLTFDFAETSDPLQDSVISVASSDTIEYLYLKSGYKCLKESDIESCQTLANICVLQLYDLENSACKLYKYINSLKPNVENAIDPGRRKGMPWLYYENKANNVINNTERVQFSVSFDPNDQIDVNLLDFYIAKYDILGKYYGMEKLTNQITLCGDNYEDGTQYRSFGSIVVQTCSLDLSKYQTRNYTMYFYEIFLLDPTTNNFIDIPIMIDNIPNPKAFDKNRLNNSTDPTDWVLTRRFFLVDNLSALQTLNSFKSKTDIPIALRFPKLIKLIILLQNTSKPKIMVPYIEIFYKSKIKNLIENLPRTYVIFISEYKMSIENFKSVMVGIFVALNILVGIMVAVKMYIWYKLNPPALSPDNYFLWFLGNAIIKLFADWGLMMFWFCWGISAYWFLFFKLQYRVFILLPQYNNWFENYRSFDIIFGIACTAYSFYMFYKVYRQVSIDIFFIDWEHEKEILIKNAAELRPEKYRGAWRLVFVANQFNELQKKRYISFAFSFFWVVFTWWYLDWGLTTQSIPGAYNRAKNSPENYVLRHFVGTFVLLCSGIGHLTFNYLFQLCIPLCKQEFVDLCCVSNISVFILDQSLHGYYIHGVSPAGKADTNLDELLSALEEEGTGKVKGRGLIEKDNDNLQTYELFVSYKMRTVYDGIYGMQSENMILSAQNTDKIQNQSRITNFLRALPKTLQIDMIYKLKSYMNSKLKEKIQKISNQPLRYVKEKTRLQRFLNYPPIELVGDTTDDIVLFKDPNMTFDDVLLSGIEWEWYIWDIFVYQMWMLTLNSCSIAIFLTFVCDKILYTARAFWGEKNLSRKAIVDNKFFMSNSNH